MKLSICRARAWVAFCAAMLMVTADSTFAQETKPPALASLVTAEPSRTVLGEVTRENQTHIEVLDLKTGDLQTFTKAELKSIRNRVSEQTAIDAVGLPNYMAWRIKKVLPAASAMGKIAQIDDAIVFATLGTDSGIEVGQELVVYRGVSDIKDPDTGKVIGKQRRKVARLEAISVDDALTKAKLIGDLEIKLEIGDQVEPAAVKNAVAVFPLVNSDDSETVGTKRIAEELTTGLVKRGVRVVERRLLESVLGELNRQQGGGFDSAKAQRVGKQLGAFGIVVGTVSPKNKFVEAQLRFVSVESGEILIAASQVIRDTEAKTEVAIKDPFTAKSVWEDVDGRVLTVVERRGDKFSAIFAFKDQIARAVAGTIQNGKVGWLPKDVRVLKGKGPGGENTGTIVADSAGYRIDFDWRDEGGASGKFTLRLAKGKTSP